MAHIHSARTGVCCLHGVAQLTPREGAGSLPALLLDQGQLPPTTTSQPCLSLGGRKGDATVFTKRKRKEAELNTSMSKQRERTMT